MPAIENLWAWSTTAINNASADDSINWVEGQDPATVNNSARSMMAALRKWQGTIGGNVLVAGTGNAITITTPVGISAADVTYGFRICFIAQAINTGGTTVAVDGLSPVGIKRNNGDALAPGDITTGGIYDIAFDGFQYKLLGAGPGLGTYGTLTSNNTWSGTNTFTGDTTVGNTNDDVTLKGQPLSTFMAAMLPKTSAAAVRSYLGIGTTNDVAFNSVTTTGYLASGTGLLLGGVNPFGSVIYETAMLATLTQVASGAAFGPGAAGARVAFRSTAGTWGYYLCT